MDDLLLETELMMTRRQLFGCSALGLGTAAMAGLMGAQFDGRGVEERDAPSGQGEASDLPFHEWRAITSGFVGL